MPLACLPDRPTNPRPPACVTRAEPNTHDKRARARGGARGGGLGQTTPQLDFVVVVTGLLALDPSMGSVSSIRTFRVLRPLKSLSVVPGLQKLVVGMLKVTTDRRRTTFFFFLSSALFCLSPLVVAPTALARPHHHPKDSGAVSVGVAGPRDRETGPPPSRGAVVLAPRGAPHAAADERWRGRVWRRRPPPPRDRGRSPRRRPSTSRRRRRDRSRTAATLVDCRRVRPSSLASRVGRFRRRDRRCPSC